MLLILCMILAGQFLVTHGGIERSVPERGNAVWLVEPNLTRCRTGGAQLILDSQLI